MISWVRIFKQQNYFWFPSVSNSVTVFMERIHIQHQFKVPYMVLAQNMPTLPQVGWLSFPVQRKGKDTAMQAPHCPPCSELLLHWQWNTSLSADSWFMPTKACPHLRKKPTLRDSRNNWVQQARTNRTEESKSKEWATCTDCRWCFWTSSSGPEWEAQPFSSLWVSSLWRIGKPWTLQSDVCVKILTLLLT
jgi:hypothetical protein